MWRRHAMTVVLTVSMVVSVTSVGLADHADPVKLSHDPTTPGSNVGDVEFSPDGRWVVFVSDVNGVDDEYAVFSAPADGSAAPVQINEDPVPGGRVDRFTISPDSNHIVYSGDLDLAGTTELYTRKIDGTGPQTKLGNAEPGGGIQGAFVVSPDSSRVVYMGALDTVGRVELYSRAIDGTGSQAKLNETPVTDGAVRRFRITPDGSRVIYSGDLDTDETDELYARAVDGAGTQTKVNAFGAVDSFELSPDGSRVVMLDYVGGLFSRASNGTGSQVKLNETPTPGGHVLSFKISPDGSRVVFRGDLDTDETDELYARAIDGTGTQTKLSNTETGGSVEAGYVITPDSSRVVYTGDLDATDVTELYSRAVDGTGTQTRINETPVTDGDVTRYTIHPDSSRVLYDGDLDSNGTIELYSRAVDGTGTQTKLNDPPTSGGGTGGFTISPDGSRVVFRGDLDTDETDELYSRAIDGSGPQTTLNDPPTNALGDIIGWDIAPDSSRVVYRGDLDTEDTREIWSTDRGQLPPPAPTDAAASSVGTDSAMVSWTAPPTTSRTDSYTVTIDPAPAAAPRRPSAAAQQTTTATSIELTGLDPDTTYTVEITADNHGGRSAAAATQFTTLAPDGVHRLSGDDRFETAVAVALDRFDPADVDTVYIAVGSNFPDALTGGPLAAQDGAPILLVRTGSLPEVVESALGTFGPSRVVAFGGAAAVSDAVLDAAAAAAGAGTTSDRIAGLNRYETAAAIAAALDTSGVDTAFLATGANFPDALAGGPATGGAPILLASSAGLPEATADALAGLGPDMVTALGGVAAVSEETLAAAATAAGAGTGTGRLSGPDRFITATEIAGTLSGVDTVYVGVGTNFPDALAAGPAAFAEGAPIVLTRTDALPDATRAHLDGIVGLRRIVVLGGVGAVSDAVAAELATLID